METDTPEGMLVASPDRVGAEHLGFAWSTHQYLNDYIKFADAKAGVLMTLAGGLLVFTLRLDSFERAEDAKWFAILGIGCLSLSFVAGILTVTPRLFTKETKQHPWLSLRQSFRPSLTAKGLIFWNGIQAYQDVEEFKREFFSRECQGLVDAVCEHNEELSAILCRKFFYLCWAMRLLWIGLTATAVFCAVHGFDLTTS